MTLVRRTAVAAGALALALGLCAFTLANSTGIEAVGAHQAAPRPTTTSRPLTFPGRTWDRAKRPEDLGFSSEKLRAAQEFSRTTKTAAVMIVTSGRIVDAWGDTAKKYLTHSVRKSFLSAVYGRYVQSGAINLERTLADLEIDDDPPLTPEEKRATIRDCLKARSGVFHTAEAENDAMHNLKPKRGTFRPGEFWLYNNWDFNVLGTIFQKLTGKHVFQAIKEDLAVPTQMEDFQVDDGGYNKTGRSIHPAYMFVVSARDVARLGLLMLRGGMWNGTQVVPADWVRETTSYCSDATIYRSDGYGYMWWVAKRFNKYPHFPNVDVPDGTYSARGAGGHFLVVIPSLDLVVVHRVDTFVGHNVTNQEFGTLLKMILDARLR